MSSLSAAPDLLRPPPHLFTVSSAFPLVSSSQRVTLNYVYLSLLNERIRVTKHRKLDNIMRRSSGICGLCVTTRWGNLRESGRTLTAFSGFSHSRATNVRLTSYLCPLSRPLYSRGKVQLIQVCGVWQWDQISFTVGNDKCIFKANQLLINLNKLEHIRTSRPLLLIVKIIRSLFQIKVPAA